MAASADELARRAAVVAARREQFERLGVQHQCAIEFSERDQRVAELAAQIRVHLRVALALDQRQHAFVQRCRAHHVTLALRDESQALRGDHFEMPVAARQRAPAHGFVGGGTRFVAAEQALACLRAVDGMQRVAEHVARLEEGLRIAQPAAPPYRAARVVRRAAPPDPSPPPARIRGPPAVPRRGARRWNRRPRENAPAPIRRCAARRRSRTAARARGSRVGIRLPPATACRAAAWKRRAASRSGSSAARQACGLPRATSSLAVPSASKPSRRWLAEASGRRVRPAQDAYRRGAFPAALVDAVECQPQARRCLQPNYHAEQPVAQVGVGQLGVARTGVDADAQVDVAFADFEKVDAGVAAGGSRCAAGCR